MISGKSIRSAVRAFLTLCGAHGATGNHFPVVDAHWCRADASIDIKYSNCNTFFDMPCDNTGACLSQNTLISVNAMALINGKSLQLDCRSATIFRQGGKSHV